MDIIVAFGDAFSGPRICSVQGEKQSAFTQQLKEPIGDEMIVDLEKPQILEGGKYLQSSRGDLGTSQIQVFQLGEFR